MSARAAMLFALVFFVVSLIIACLN